MLRWLPAATLLAFAAPVPALAQTPVPEIATPGLGDIAKVTVHAGQVVILYDPMVCQQMGSYLCGFFRAHEYGHVALGHAVVPTFPPQAEHDADCWAGMNARPAELGAAVRFFAAGGAGFSPAHGTGPQRANRILRCAQGRRDFFPPRGQVCCTGMITCMTPAAGILSDSCGCWTQMGPVPGWVCE